MANAAASQTFYVTVNAKDAANTLYTLLSARTGRFLFQSARVVTLTQTGSGTVPQWSLGTETTTYENIVNFDTGYLRANGGVNFNPDQDIASSASEDYMAYADLATNGLKLRLVTPSGATTHTALIAITGIVV